MARHRRRDVLRLLSEEDGRATVDQIVERPDEIESVGRTRIEIGLHHRDLPTMAENDVIDVDGGGSISLTATGETAVAVSRYVERLLEEPSRG